MSTSTHFGTGSASYEAAGEEAGISQLVNEFYEHMDALEHARVVRAMHPPDLGRSREKLTTFLCAWLGGPNRYRERFGPISIPRAHAHFDIDESERDAWLACMQRAVDSQPWDEAFKDYFMRAIAVPAERVREASAARRESE
jgi:hemoglobin